MVRKSLIIFALIGLVLIVLAWPVSYMIPSLRTRQYQFFLQNGAISATWIAQPSRPVGIRMTDKNGRPIEDQPTVPTGFMLLGSDSAVPTSWLPIHISSPQHRFLLIPLWFPLVVCASTLWLMWGPPYRRRKRKRLGLCLACGYDLRRSAERCPECGRQS